MIRLINKKENILGDDIGYVENWDFSKANMSNENRIHAITLVASICYQSPKALGSESLYNRLMAESHGLPSSSFEYVPMLFSQKEITSLYCTRTLLVSDNNPLTKFGEWIEDGEYLLTNFRAVVYLFEKFGIDFRDKFNTEEECEIIARHFKVFKYYVDLPTRAQMVRHRVNWQELCVTGDTLIHTSQGKRTIKDMYDIQEKNKTVKGYKYPTIKSYDFTTKTFFQTPVKEIFKTGRKEVFEVTIQYGVNGKTYKIKTSAEHKFLTKGGWERLKDIPINSFVAINGEAKWRNKDWCTQIKTQYLLKGKGLKSIAEEECINYNTLKKWFHKHGLQYTPSETASTFTVWNKGITGEQSHSFGVKHSDEVRQKISDKHVKELGTTRQGFAKRVRSYWEAEFRKSKLLKKCDSKCVTCGSTSKLEVDHIKPVFSHPELGFDENNVQILCKKCHKEKSNLDVALSKNTIRYGMITSIKSLGEEDTYDLEVDHVDHNYVANGIVVHNSRRYVSGKRVPFDFYISEKMKFESYHSLDAGMQYLDEKDFNEICVERYNQALDRGVKPEEARRCIPQSMYTTIWGAFQPTQLENYFKLRSDQHAQKEIRATSDSMKELIGS